MPGPVTRSRARAMALAATDTSQHMSEATPSAQITSRTSTRRRPTETQMMTEEHCNAFINNPYVNPVTKNRIKIGGPTFTQLMGQCRDILRGKDLANEMVVTIVGRDTPDAANMCVQLANGINHQNMTILNPFNKERYAMASEGVMEVIDKCKRTHNVLFLHINAGPATNNVYTHIPIKLSPVPFTRRIKITNMEVVKEIVSSIIISWTAEQNIEVDVINQIISGLSSLIDAGYVVDEDADDLREMLAEIVAIKNGIVLEASNDKSPSNKSKSWSPKDTLPPLPRGSSAELLQQLDKACIEMQDMITLDEFSDWANDKKKLQLIVQVGRQNAEGKKRCYYVKNIYDHVKSMVDRNLIPKEPVSNTPITPEEIRDVIMPKMRYLNPNAKTPGTVQRRTYPKLELIIKDVVTVEDNIPFYEIRLLRTIGTSVKIDKLIGYIRADIETNDADINSTVIIARVRDLFDQGRLVDARGNMRAHLNKSVSYWFDEQTRKARLMLDELNML